MFGGSEVHMWAGVEISKGFELRYVVNQSTGEVELTFSGDTELTMSFSRAAFAQLQEKWPELVAKFEAASDQTLRNDDLPGHAGHHSPS